MTTQTAMAYSLICDFALGPLGELQGLTPAELRRAYVARHGVVPTRRAHALLSEDLLVVRIAPRNCAITGRRNAPYVPSVQIANRTEFIKPEDAQHA